MLLDDSCGADSTECGQENQQCHAGPQSCACTSEISRFMARLTSTSLARTMGSVTLLWAASSAAMTFSRVSGEPTGSTCRNTGPIDCCDMHKLVCAVWGVYDALATACCTHTRSNNATIDTVMCCSPDAPVQPRFAGLIYSLTPSCDVFKRVDFAHSAWTNCLQ